MKLIVLLIDGLSADYFEGHRHRLPNLSAIAAQGTHVRRLGATFPATSMPGRASMLTGVTAAKHGVIGNHIFDGTGFRCAMPQDVAVETIAGRALAQGLDVACIGFGLVRPQDVGVFRPPWWMRGFLDGSRFAKLPAFLTAPFADRIWDPEGRLPPLQAAPSDGVLAGVTADLAMIDAVAQIACSSRPPDLILTEIATTDVIQHSHGYATAASHWALSHADMLVGRLLCALRLGNRLADYAIAVASDHGHAPIGTAIHPDTVIPEASWESEGASLHVMVESERHAATVQERLAAFGVLRHPADHIPPAHRLRVAVFSAPPGHSFEPRPKDAPPGQSTGKPAYVSSHGLRPGDPADDRFCAFYGSGIGKSVISSAAAEQFASTAAVLLGLHLSACNAEPLHLS